MFTQGGDFYGAGTDFSYSKVMRCEEEGPSVGAHFPQEFDDFIAVVFIE
ncbi:MAG: hypothetical protein L0L66_09340 [Bifidobacterium crudilactis]|nr:hypothetical protein [Bifidobacterium crudilactis]